VPPLLVQVRFLEYIRQWCKKVVFFFYSCLSKRVPPLLVQVRFLEYIRQWRKKVVFVVNKADLLSSPAEVEQVLR